jgi:hypothetical protein
VSLRRTDINVAVLAADRLHCHLCTGELSAQRTDFNVAVPAADMAHCQLCTGELTPHRHQCGCSCCCWRVKLSDVFRWVECAAHRQPCGYSCCWQGTLLVVYRWVECTAHRLQCGCSCCWHGTLSVVYRWVYTAQTSVWLFLLLTGYTVCCVQVSLHRTDINVAVPAADRVHCQLCKGELSAQRTDSDVSSCCWHGTLSVAYRWVECTAHRHQCGCSCSW